MEELTRIFKQLDNEQVKISIKNCSLTESSLTKSSLTKSSLIDLDDYTKYDFSDNYDYKDNIWFILYYLRNEIDDKTYIEQNSMFKEYMMTILESYGEEKKSKLYDRKELSNSIQKILNTSLSTKLYLSNLYNINIYVLYVSLDICIKFGNHEDSYLFLYDNDKMSLYYEEDDDYECDIDDDDIVTYDDLNNYKKLKITELKKLCEKLHIDLTKDDKKKTKALLINDVEEFLENML